MILNYEVRNSYAKLKDDCKAFMLDIGEKLIINVEGIEINKCFVYFDNGKESTQFVLPKLESFEVPDFMLVAGELQIRVAQFNRTKVRSLTFEPITIVAKDTGFEGHTAFDDLKARVETLEAQVNSLLPLLNEMNELHRALEQ